ncbi:fructose-6-phosphate aldolase [Neobacillus sp. NPDC097160]|uniref:fructose-6-phosphate aldolase n=1 Tax=Neobacillus sp. NPDC097160 TaxID=3364298 RepID=UPI0037FC5E54
MELMFDTANLNEIEYYSKIFPIKGVTTNPSILKKEERLDVFTHLKKIRNIIGTTSSLHVQVTTDTSEEMVKEAYTIAEKLGKDIYIKIPVNEEGLKAIRILKREQLKITATAIYTMAQGDFAIMAGSDYIAPYFNRMENININSTSVINHFSTLIKEYNMETKILAASFKNIGQVMRAFESGAHCATVDPSLLHHSLKMPAIEDAVSNFKRDWEDVYGNGVTLQDL